MGDSIFYCDGRCDTCSKGLQCEPSDYTDEILVAVVGMPNSGRSSLISLLKRQGEFDAENDCLVLDGCKLRFLDVQDVTPDANARMMANAVAAFIRHKSPNLVLNVIDATHLEDSLQLTSELIDMHLPLVVALNHYDELLHTGHSIKYEQLGKMMGFSAFPMDAFSVEKAQTLLRGIVSAYNQRTGIKHTHVPYGQDLEESIAKIESILSGKTDLHDFDQRYLAIRLLENSEEMRPLLKGFADEIIAVTQQESSRLRRSYGKAPAVLIDNARAGFVHGALTETLVHSQDNSDHSFLQKLDAVLTSKWLGIPLLILVLFLVFEATFMLGAYPQQWIDSGVNMLSEWLRAVLQKSWFSSMLVDGVVQGVGAVLSFLPNIVILFFFLSLLEDFGYMSRAAFVMDKLMHKIGLHGRSFIPMLIGFGCNVPAIMAARSIDNEKDRTLTMLMIPFMSCSARLPVYMLFVAAFFAKHKAIVMISIYVIGVLFSILFAFIMKRTKYFRQEQSDYVSTLPPFRKPTIRNTGAHIWERTADYLKKISTVILAASVIIWALEYFPSDRTENGQNKEESYLAMVGRGMEPIMRPLGFDWKMNVCILTGLPAKEAIVSTMGILYHANDDNMESLTDVMHNEVYTSGPRIGQPVFTPAVSWSFMIFVLLYFPCVATIAALRREIGRKWAAFTVVHSLTLAWVAAFLVFQIGSFFL